MIFVSPIELVIEFSFVFLFKAFDNLGMAIIGISFLVSFLTLPLYHISDKLQKRERRKRESLKPGVERIKAVFKGDERYMILTTFYRQNNYHPVYALRSSISLLIQVPFFIAAYHFLSNLPELHNESFLFINDLGVNDGLIHMGDVAINILPIFMTLINISSGILYTKGFPLRDKIQVYGIALLFLVLLYQAPAGLVLYWTLNNIFSLIRNLFYKFRNPLKVLYIFTVAGTISLTTVLLFSKIDMPLLKQTILVIGALFICILPLILKGLDKLHDIFLSNYIRDQKNVFLLFLLSLSLLWSLHGLLIPANLIASAPIEFSHLGSTDNPLFYIFKVASLFFGFWILWPLFIYSISSKKTRGLLSFIFIVVSFSALANTYLFKGNYGIINNIFIFEDPPLLIPEIRLMILPFLFFLLSIMLLVFLLKKEQIKVLVSSLVILLMASGSNGIYSMTTISQVYRTHTDFLTKSNTLNTAEKEIEPVISLSDDNKNVIVIMLDRAISSYFPIILDQFPKMAEQFSGFTFYPNTVSFGAHTISGAPPLLGGYEYTPDSMNKRSEEKLVNKHNEAILVLPQIFLQEGYNVTVLDPPFPNYSWSDDFSIFDSYPEITVKSTIGRYTSHYFEEHEDEVSLKASQIDNVIQNRFPVYSLLMTTFPIIRNILYDDGAYFLMLGKTQNIDTFIDSYSVLHYLPQLTAVDSHSDSYIFLKNHTTHDPIFLEAPDYIPVWTVKNYYSPLRGNKNYGESEQIHYHANVAALLKIGEWFDFLRTLNVYDNSRIVIVADHGYDIVTPAFKDFSNNKNLLGFYNPLLLMKDFNRNEDISFDYSFMTNADVPIFSVKDIVSDPINPFTNRNLFNEIDKANPNVYKIPFLPNENTGAMFNIDVSRSFSIHDNIFDESNWVPIDQKQ